MKTFKMVIWGILILYFQILFAARFRLFGITPNFLIAFIIYTSIHLGLRSSLTISFIGGLAFDLILPYYLGMNTLTFVILAMLINTVHESVNKRRTIVVFFSILIINMIYYLFFGFYQMIAFQNMSGFFLLYFLSVFYNSVITFFSIYFFIILSKIKLSVDV
ncbi:MAG TPA: rod shape-determining protein MreD [Candidatus Cloacimonadota bacterium]|nr:rod shape-determining protein MreD [Candidatus Cloacimonadota bacterium]